MKLRLLSLLAVFLLFVSQKASAQTQTWEERGGGTNGPVNALYVDNVGNTLYVGGAYTATGTGTGNFNRIARWDGAKWTLMTSLGANNTVNAITKYNGNIWVGGKFTAIGGVPVNGVAFWNGSVWTGSQTSFPANVTVYDLKVYNSLLYAATSKGVKVYDNTTDKWANAGVNPLKGPVYSLMVYNKSLVAGGAFNASTGDAFNYLAYFNTKDSKWAFTGAGANDTVKTLYAFNNKMIVGGKFTKINGLSMNGVCSTDSVVYTSTGNTQPGEYAFLDYHAELYAYGSFTGTGGNTFCKWDGLSNWAPITVSVNKPIRAMVSYSDTVYAGGDFDYLDNNIVPVGHFAKFVPRALSVYQKTDSVTCYGLSDGKITTSGYGGTPPYTYAWSNTVSTSNINTGLSTGTFTVTVTDAALSTATLAINVLQPNPLVAVHTESKLTCYGVSCSAPTGGNKPYTYKWSGTPLNGQNTSCMTGYIGPYTITVTDSKQCTATSSLVLSSVSSFPSPVVNASGPVNFCGGSSVTLTASPADVYRWNTHETTQSITVTASGTYYVQLTNASQCITTSNSTNVAVTPTPANTTYTVSGPLAFCEFTDSTKFSTTINPAFHYQWLRNGNPMLAGDTGAVYYAKQSGTYSLKTFNNCGTNISAKTTTVNVVIVPPPTPTNPPGVCQGSTSACVGITGNSNYKWYDAPSPATPVFSGSCFQPPTTTIGTLTYYVTQSAFTAGVGTCESVQSPFTVLINGTSPPTPLTPINYCYNDVATPLNGAATNPKWYTSSTGGTPIAVPTPTTAVTGTTSYYVTETLNGCESNRALVEVTVYRTFAPVVSDLGYCLNAPSAALTAGGTNLLWYSTLSGGTGSATAPTPSTAVLGATTYYVTQTLNACESPRDSIVVTVSTVPAPTVSPVDFCLNSTPPALTISDPNPKWYYVSTGGTSYPAIIPTTSATGTTTYYVSQTISGCEGPRAGIVVNVKGLPPAPTANNHLVTICQQAPALPLTAIGNNLLWYTASTGGFGTPNAPVPLTNHVGKFYFYVSQTVNGCEGPRDSIAVVVKVKPNAGIAVIGSTSICVDGSVLLKSMGDNPGDQLKWSDGSVDDSLWVNQQKAYALMITNAFGCKDTSDSVHIIVQQVVPPTILYNGPTSFCYGRTAILMLDRSYNGYHWSNGDIDSASKVIASGTYGVTVNDNLGCTAASTNSVKIDVGTPGVFSVIAQGPLTFCAGDSVILSNSDASSTYVWNTVPATTAGSVTIKTSGTYMATATDAAGCRSISQPVTVKVNDLPVAKISQTGTVLVSSPGAKFQWKEVDKGNIAGATNDTLIVTENGKYIVKVTNKAGCSAWSDTATVNFLISGIGPLTSLADFKVFPNPFAQNATFSYSLSHTEDVLVEVYDMLGNKVTTLVNERLSKGSYELKLDKQAIPSAGVYLLKIKVSNQAKVLKITHTE